MSENDFLRVEASGCPMSSCAAPAGSPCRTGRERVAAQYHTARLRLVPHLAKALAVPVPPLRKPGSAWTGLPRPPAPGTAPAGHVRIGYARASTVRQSLDTQLDSLRASGVTRIFAEKVSTRAMTRPELEKAVALVREIRAAGVAVTVVVHEHKRLGRGLDLAALAGQLRASGIGLEFLAGELAGSHDPSRDRVHRAGCAVGDGTRVHPRPDSRGPRVRPRAGQGHRRRRRHRRRDARRRAPPARAGNEPARHRRRLVISAGKKKGQHPFPATVLRMLRDHDEKAAAAAVPAGG